MSDTPKPYESDTPETCEAVERWQQGKINIFDEMARLERERDEARNIARWLYQHGMATLKEGAYRRPWVKEVIR